MKMDPFGGLVSPTVARHLAERSAQSKSNSAPPERLAQPRANPWGLTAGQCEALDALCKTGTDELAGELLGLNCKTIAGQISRAKDRMGIHQRLILVLTWDRWVRAHQETNQ